MVQQVAVATAVLTPDVKVIIIHQVTVIAVAQPKNAQMQSVVEEVTTRPDPNNREFVKDIRKYIIIENIRIGEKNQQVLKIYK